MKKLPVLCPSCDASLQVSELSCNNCDTKITGSYPLHELLQLSLEEQQFLLAFVTSSGSLKQMASQMKKSYPTVRNYLDDLIEKINQLKNISQDENTTL